MQSLEVGEIAQGVQCCHTSIRAWDQIPKIHIKCQAWMVGTISAHFGKAEMNPWDSLASSSSGWIKELYVQWETLSQRIVWRVTEDDPSLSLLLASMCTCMHMYLDTCVPTHDYTCMYTAYLCKKGKLSISSFFKWFFHHPEISFTL